MEDLTGMTFGQWTVLRRDNSKQYKSRGKRWVCLCSCGTERSVMGKHLKNGKSTSCGCSQKVDLAGKRFERLLVVETLYNYNGSNKATYRCICDCGNEVYLTSASLGKQKSCGCVRFIDRTGETYGKLTIVEMLYGYKNGQTYCRCECECGNNNYITRADGLVTGNTTSCGCTHSPSLIGQRFGLLVVNQEVINDSKQRIWECQCDCGNVVNRTSTELKRFYSCGCLQNKSIMEAFVKSVLDDNHIEHIPQQRFDDCKDVFSLPFDFYLPAYHICIECDGIQHFEPVAHFGGEAAFQIRKRHDQIKTNYCLLNNIKLVRLPYTLSNEEIKNILLNAIKILEYPVTTTAV